MKQGLLDKAWNGTPHGGPKTTNLPPVRFLTDYGQAPPPPPTPIRREAVVLGPDPVEPRPPRNGRAWLSVLLIVFVSLFVYIYFASTPAGADGNDDETIIIHIPADRQSNDQKSTPDSSSDTDFSELNLEGGARCPVSGSPVTAYLDGVQTDSVCAARFPNMWN